MDKKIIHTRRRYLYLAIAFVLLGLGLVFLPEKENKKEMQPEHLLAKLIDQSRFMSSDEIADKIINNDPSFILIDVRSADEFANGSLPGAMNIPLSEILDEEAKKIFEGNAYKAYDKVIYSNNDVLADQAWTMLARNLVERTFILQGGLNNWVKTIINPEEPKESAPTEVFELYNFRKAASRYFAGKSTPFEYIDFKERKATSTSSSGAAKKPVSVPAPPMPVEEEEEEEEEGC